MATELAASAELATYRSGDPDLLVAAAEGAVRAYCGWHIAPSRDETLTLDSDGGTTLLLPSLHVTSVTSVRDVTTEPATTLTDWVNKPTPRFAAGILQATTAWPKGQLEVALTHGYADVPPEVKAVVLDLAQHLASASGGVRRRSTGPFAVEVAQHGLNDLHRTVLDAYRLPGLP